MENIADFYYEYNLQKEFAIISESNLVSSISSFLEELGLIPKTIIITDNPEDIYKEHLIKEMESFLSSEEVDLYFEEDQGRINEIIENSEVELILGSSLEDEIAGKINVPIHHISFPIWDSVVLDKTYIGYKGAVTLLEDIATLVRNFN